MSKIFDFFASMMSYRYDRLINNTEPDERVVTIKKLSNGTLEVDEGRSDENVKVVINDYAFGDDCRVCGRFIPNYKTCQVRVDRHPATPAGQLRFRVCLECIARTPLLQSEQSEQDE